LDRTTIGARNKFWHPDLGNIETKTTTFHRLSDGDAYLVVIPDGGKFVKVDSLHEKGRLGNIYVVTDADMIVYKIIE
jgi:hypothetical protein